MKRAWWKKPGAGIRQHISIDLDAQGLINIHILQHPDEATNFLFFSTFPIRNRHS